MIAERALILAAHGSGDESQANRRVAAWADGIRRDRPGLEVVPAFQLGTPRFRQALDTVAAPRAIVVPLLTSAGFFLHSRLPAELAINRRAGEVAVRITGPIGAQSRVRRALVERARSLAASVSGTVSVVVVGHGTERDPESAVATRALAAEVAAVLPDIPVQAAFLDQPPRVDDAIRTIATDAVVIAPFLLGGGHHADDLHQLRLLVRGKELLIAQAIGDDGDLAFAALELFDQYAREASGP